MSKDNTSLENKLDMSFVIITNGIRENLIDLAIKSIHAQKIPDYEIIVVGKYKEREDTIYIEDKLNRGYQRNSGAIVAFLDNVVFIDDDIELLDGWYRAIKRYPQKWDLLGYKLLDSRLLSIGKEGIDARLKWDYVHADENFQPHSKPYEEEPDERTYCSTGCLLVKKYVFDKVKFKEIQKGEDMHFGLDCNKAGFKLGLCREAMGVHHFQP